MAGKTTLVNSLLEIYGPPIDPKDRTPGIEIHFREIPGVGKGTTWDFGAQSTFYGAHGLFFQQSNTMFLLVLPIRKGEKLTPDVVCRLLEKGRFWCAFAKASLRPLSIHPKSLIRLVIIFNLIGFTDKAEMKASFRLKEIAERLRKNFEHVFEISHVIEMDCSESQSYRMMDCRGKLRVVREKILEVISNCATYVHVFFLCTHAGSRRRSQTVPHHRGASLSSRRPKKAPIGLFSDVRRIREVGG